MEMDQDVMKALLEAFEQSDWQEMTVTIGGDRLHVSRQSVNGVAPGPSAQAPNVPGPETAAVQERGPVQDAASAAPQNATAAPADGITIESPSVGLFWRAPAPGAPPFIEVGGSVAAGDTVAIVEVMKLMNHVTSPVSGTVVDVLAENGEPVEFGQVLVVIDPEA